MTIIDDNTICEWAENTINEEAHALKQLAASLNVDFSHIVKRLVQCEGKIILTGMGKSGHIGKKIAATLASTGSPAMFVHPAEASHGDLGMIEKKDVVIAISKSGESPELSDVLVYCRRFGISILAITANAESSLAKASNYLFLLPNLDEACPLGLAPTTSTVMILALGDALAIACLRLRDFQPTQFRDFHPGGKLGQKLTRVRDVMQGGEFLPVIHFESPLSKAVIEMSRGRFGCVGILDNQGEFIGIFTDGDLRRYFTADNIERPIADLMSHSPQRVSPDALIADVTHLFTEKRIPSVFVCINNKPVGIIHVHDLLQKGFI